MTQNQSYQLWQKPAWLPFTFLLSHFHILLLAEAAAQLPVAALAVPPSLAAGLQRNRKLAQQRYLQQLR